MKQRFLSILAACGVCLCLTAAARASLIYNVTDGSGEAFSLVQTGPNSYSFTVTGNDVATGTLTTSPSPYADDSVWVTGGTMHVTQTSNSNSAVGNYTIAAAGPTATGAAGFTVDNILYPNNDAGSGLAPGVPLNPSYLTGFGLLFAPVPGQAPAYEAGITIWGNGPSDSLPRGDYGFFSSAIATPEPSSLVLGVLGGVGLLLAARRRKVWRGRAAA